MYKKVFLIVSFLISSSVLHSSNDISKSMYQFTNKFSKKICKKYNLTLIASGGSAPSKIEIIDNRFLQRSCSSVEEARRLYIPIVEEMIEDINNDHNLRQHLKDYPATNKNVAVIISFDKGLSKETCNESLAAVLPDRKGNIYYSKLDPITDRLYDFHIETYEDAQKILSK